MNTENICVYRCVSVVPIAFLWDGLTEYLPIGCCLRKRKPCNWRPLILAQSIRSTSVIFLRREREFLFIIGDIRRILPPPRPSPKRGRGLLLGQLSTQYDIDLYLCSALSFLASSLISTRSFFISAQPYQCR